MAPTRHSMELCLLKWKRDGLRQNLDPVFKYKKKSKTPTYRYSAIMSQKPSKYRLFHKKYKNSTKKAKLKEKEPALKS